eukprot:6572-Heterococcus_DN1.PRE.1
MDPALINRRDNIGFTPLHCAMDGQHDVEIVSLLLAHGADVHARCSLGQSALSNSYNAAVTRLLLEAGADVNARDYLGNTVLHNAAVLTFSASVLCCLLKAGADATAIHTYKATPAEVARAHAHSATAALLNRAERVQQCTRQAHDGAPMLPLHLRLSGNHSWHCNTDVSHRRAVFSGLVKISLFDAQPDRAELVQCVEFELYSTATNLAEYRDKKTLQQRAVA